ncbi:MAG: helix-turn-helix transcriptional regulator [Oscillospiraceae bacterium]|nr:helix-turn-helix transcriptional regulator [Oscillospiraceae bacterium]
MTEIIKIRKLEGLAARRKAAGYTQEELSAILGVSRPALTAWEIGQSTPRAGILPAIADLLLCTIDDLYKAPEGTDCHGAGAPRNDSMAPESAEPPHQSPAATASTQGEALEGSIPDLEEV